MDYPDWFIVPPTTSVEHRLAILEDLAVLGSQNPRVQALAKSLVAARPDDPLQALLDGLHRYVNYTPDPNNGEVELFQRAEYTLFVRHLGDCDDMSIAYASLARAVGINARTVWIEQAEDVPNNHVAAQVCTKNHAAAAAAAGRVDYAVQVFTHNGGHGCNQPDGWAWVETTLPGAIVGRHPYAEAERLKTTRSDLRGDHMQGTTRSAGQIVGTQSQGGVLPWFSVAIAILLVGATVAGISMVTSGTGLARRRRR